MLIYQSRLTIYSSRSSMTQATQPRKDRAMTTGLEGVVVADTVLSEVDGERGRLIVRGEAIEALTGHVSFEAVAARLWDGLAPGEDGDVTACARRIGAGRALAFERLGPVL